MKKILIPAVLIGAAMQITSCKEVIPTVAPSANGSDTTYLAGVEAKQDRIVMIEEFTGVSCPPCPRGHEALAAIYDANPGRVAIVGMQPYNVLQADPVEKDGVIISKHDNRTQKGTDIGTMFGGLGVGIPTGMVDRKYDGVSSYYYNFSTWAGLTTSRLSVATPLNIALTSSVSSSNVATTTVKVSFTEAVTTKQYLVVVLTEDSVIDAQKDGLAIDTNYVHMHLLRDILTAGTPGKNILGSYASIEPGRVYQSTFTYSINAGWNADHCHVIAYVVKNETGDKEVQQAAIARLK